MLQLASPRRREIVPATDSASTELWAAASAHPAAPAGAARGRAARQYTLYTGAYWLDVQPPERLRDGGTKITGDHIPLSPVTLPDAH
jgi:hypothetical protein